MKYLALAIIIFVILVGGEYLLRKQPVDAPTTTTTAGTTGNQQPPLVKASKCGLTVNSPLVGSTVTFPLSINATVDNSNTSAACSWTVFEAQAGPIVIKDGAGNTLATSFLATTANWMTTAPTVYTATIASLSNPNYSGPLNIIFEEENPADFPNPDTLTVSVIK
jgi:hypothetical protein